MGRFFTSTQIYNPKQLDQSTIIDHFYKGMKELGYIPCNSDESEISYIMRFADNCKWVTITSDAYEQGNQFAQADTGKIAKMLKTVCINTTVIDSDCAILDLYDESGKKKDALIMGRVDDYLGNNNCLVSKSTWNPFLADESSWAKLCEIVMRNDRYTSVEECLSELATVIGMDCKNILFSAVDTDENKQTVFLNFKKSWSKKEKELSLNAAFKLVFGELLEPLGFRLAKSKYPYYIRVVGEGIVQAISFSKEKSLPFDSNRSEEGVEIYVGIDLLINPLINFDKNPTIVDNQKWMITLNELYRRFKVYMDNFKEEHEAYSFFYKKGDTEEMLDALIKSKDELMPFVLEFLEKLNTLDALYQLGEITSSIRQDVIILLGKTDELIEHSKENLKKKIEMLEAVHANKPEYLDFLKKRAVLDSEKKIKRVALYKKGAKKYNEFIKNAEETKKNNMEILEKLGVI